MIPTDDELKAFAASQFGYTEEKDLCTYDASNNVVSLWRDPYGDVIVGLPTFADLATDALDRIAIDDLGSEYARLILNQQNDLHVAVWDAIRANPKEQVICALRAMNLMPEGWYSE